MFWKKGTLFCDINPTCYAISVKKEVLKRHLKNLLGKDKFAKTRQMEKLPHVVWAYDSGIIKRGKGIDIRLQENKAVNIELACAKMNGTVIRPGEVFSFWQKVGPTTGRRGYKEGRVLEHGALVSGLGGGLCNLANTIHLLVLHSPLTVTEFHPHSDALAPDTGGRMPFSSGTSVGYNYVDYRFRNDTDQNLQLLLWCADDRLYGELRSEREFPTAYEIVEEGHHFRREGEKYYRVSKIYQQVTDKATGDVVEKKLVLDNHSEVMFDYDLIPQEQIRE